MANLWSWVLDANVNFYPRPNHSRPLNPQVYMSPASLHPGAKSLLAFCIWLLLHLNTVQASKVISRSLLYHQVIIKSMCELSKVRNNGHRHERT